MWPLHGSQRPKGDLCAEKGRPGHNQDIAGRVLAEAWTCMALCSSHDAQSRLDMACGGRYRLPHCPVWPDRATAALSGVKGLHQRPGCRLAVGLYLFPTFFPSTCFFLLSLLPPHTSFSIDQALCVRIRNSLGPTLPFPSPTLPTPPGPSFVVAIDYHCSTVSPLSYSIDTLLC